MFNSDYYYNFPNPAVRGNTGGVEGPPRIRFDNVLPGTLATGQASLWTANASSWLPYTLGALKVFSWILVALLLAGVTGLLRKT